VSGRAQADQGGVPGGGALVGLTRKLAVMTAVSARPLASAGTVTVRVTVSAAPLGRLALAGCTWIGQPWLELATTATLSGWPPELRRVCV